MKATGNWLILMLFFVTGYTNSFAERIKDRKYKYRITIPEQMVRVTDTAVDGRLYYDTVAGMIIFITTNENKFRSVNDYVNCSREDLEQQLRLNYDDTTFKLVSCSVSDYFPQEANRLCFQVCTPPYGYDAHTIYFIHHRGKDIQIWFSYRKGRDEMSRRYIESVMNTLRLK